MKRFEANQPGSRAFLKRTFLVLFFFVSIHALTAGVSIDGDGAEYLAYTRSFAYRFSPFLKAGDFDSKANQEKFTQLENSQGTPLGLGKNSTEIIEDPDGLFFSVHFWLYSLFCAPLLLLLESLGQNGGKTFILTNYLMACGAFYYILFQSRQTAFFRYHISILFLLSGFTYYFGWSHPEIFTASFTLLGLMSVLDRRYGLAFFFLALASTQNPPAVFYLLIPVFFSFKKYVFLKRTQTLKREGAWMIAGVGVFILPYLFYFSKLHVLNPIQSMGGYNFQDATLDRFLSFFFDLNQGMMLGFTALFLIPFAWWRAQKTALSPDQKLIYQKALGFMLIGFLPVIGVLGIDNWNTASTVEARYSVWASVPFAIALTIFISLGLQPRKWSLVVLGLQFLTISSFGFLGGGSNATHFNSLSRFVLSHHPSLYNPDPEIFCDRVQGKEPCDYHQTFIFRTSEGIPMKILAPMALSEQEVFSEICPGEPYPAEGTFYHSKSLSSRHLNYFNGPFHCRP